MCYVAVLVILFVYGCVSSQDGRVSYLTSICYWFYVYLYLYAADHFGYIYQFTIHAFDLI
uniref:Transmembrane 9 superfamily member n=1 Tax=Setaria viridis TaxID=4556 RepID=A0A4U6TCA5_SETVI|nr:hypothetical protein SEVIR_8G059850v2 [Setaria viridis]